MSSQTTNPKPLPGWSMPLAGAVGGVVEILTMYPTDIAKTRMQLEAGKSQGMVKILSDIARKEGFARLYRGLAAPLTMEAPKRAVKFAANDYWGKTYKYLAGTTEMTQALSLATGCTAGATESFVVTPFELIKIRLQDKTSTFKGPLDVIKRTIQSDGLLGMYAGMEATFWRHFWWNGGYFGVIFQIRSHLPKTETNSGKLLNNFTAGTIGGLCGTVLNTPFDVVKSRIQGTVKVPGVVPKYNWTYPSLILVAREEGIKSLFKGFIPKATRLGPGGGILLLVVDFTINQMRKIMGPPYV